MTAADRIFRWTTVGNTREERATARLLGQQLQ
jgi:hypothetical protein